MQKQENSDLPKFNEPEEINDTAVINPREATDVAEDTDPPLDQEDLEENNLTIEDADQVVWDPPKRGSAGSEEKDITD